MKRFGISVPFSIVLILFSVACSAPARTAEEEAGAVLMLNELQKVSGGDLIEMRDGRFYFVFAVTGKNNVLLVPRVGAATIQGFWDSEWKYDVSRIVKTNDPEYPAAAAKFLRRSCSTCSDNE